MTSCQTQILDEICGDPKHVAVLVIDMQGDFCSPDGEFARRGVDISANTRIIRPLAEFVDDMRALGALIVWIRQEASELYKSPAIRRRLEKAPERSSLCTAGTSGWELVDGLTVRVGDATICKYRYSAFFGSSLDQLLRSMGIRTVVLVGTAAKACVDTTARDAAQLDYDVVVASDLVGYTDQRLAEAALENLDRHFAFVIPSGEVLRALGRVANGDERALTDIEK